VSIENAKMLFMLFCIMLGLIIVSPTLFALVSLPEGERFSELWLLGTDHLIENGVLNVSLNKPDTVHLGVCNQMGGTEYYLVSVKLLNQFQTSQGMNNGMPSSLEPIFEYRFFLRNNQTWEKPFIFSFDRISFEGDTLRVSKMTINGNDVFVEQVAVRDEVDGGFYYQLLFELWIYNSTVSDFQFHDRYVWFWVNMAVL